MKIGLKKSSILSGYNRAMLGIFGIFGVSILILYIAYLNGLVGIQNEVHFVSIENIFIHKLVVPFYFISKTLLAWLPDILGFILVISYLEIFSYKAIRINIIPITNRQKMSKLFLVCGMYYLIYMLIFIIFSAFISGPEQGDIIKLVITLIGKLASEGILILMIILVDMNSKIKFLDKEVNIFWIVMLVIITGIGIEIIDFLLNKLGMGMYAMVGVRLIIIIIEGLYIMKKIDQVKMA